MNDVQKNLKSKRYFHLDLIRTIACICVCVIHSCNDLRYNNSIYTLVAIILFDIMPRVAVPLFVMVSGAIFLDEDYEFTQETLFKHVKKILIFYFFWSLVYAIIYKIIIPFYKHEVISITHFFGRIIVGHVHLWFCLMIIGLYLITPLLKLWVKKQNIKYVKYFILLSLFFSMFFQQILSFFITLFPSLETLSALVNNMKLQYVGGYTVYFILGWYLNNFVIKHKRTIILLGVLGFFISVFEALVLLYTSHAISIAYTPLSIQIMMLSVMVFMLITVRFKEYSDNKITKCCVFVARHSLGVYGIHMLFIDSFSILFASINLISPFLYILLKSICTFITSLLLSFVMSRIPILKRIV